MAINTYLQKCDYRLGGLKNYIYLVSKNALKINIKAKGIEVFWKKTKAGDILKVEGALVVFSQEESNNPKYRFQNKLEVTVEEKWEEPFLYALRTLRTNQYYIIIEDKKGNQYLVNPELFTDLNYEYNFNDGGDSSNNVLLTFFNLCNYPLLIMKEKIDNNLFMTNTQCDYNLGKINELVMISHKDLKVNDDGVKANEIYVDDTAKIKRIEYLDDSCSINEEYNNKEFKCTLKFSIPLDDNQFNWHYNLLEYQDNKYCAIARTSNHNYIIMGMEIGMTPKYNIQTSDDVDTPNVVEITFTQISQYPIVYSNDVNIFDWRDEGERRCFGFDKYQMLTQYMTPDWGKTWIKSDPIVKKKGKLIEKNSADCTEIQWVDDGGSCVYKDTYYEKWMNTKEFICEKGNKYTKTRCYTSTDKDFWTPTDAYGVGGLVEKNSADCMYVAVRWIDSDDVICAEVDESKTKWEYNREECHGTDYVKVDKEMVTNNSIDFYPSGVSKDTILIPNCCACGYYQTEDRFVKDVCYNEVINDNIYEKNENNIVITRVVGNWLRQDDEFTSNKISHYQTTVERIYFTSNDENVKLNYIQSSEINYDYLIVSKVDKTVVNSTSSSNNFSNAKNKTSGSFTIPTPIDGKEHFIELMYRKDSSGSYKNDNVIVTFNKRVKISKEQYAKYELWQTFKICDDGHTTVDELIPNSEFYIIKERNTCDCGYKGYEYRKTGYICGSEIKNSTTIISTKGNDKNWIQNGNIFINNRRDDSVVEYLQINFKSYSNKTNIKIKAKGIEKYDMLFISYLDEPLIIDTSDASVRGVKTYVTTNGEQIVTYDTTPNKEHFIQVTFKKDRSHTYGDGVEVTFIDGYDAHGKYEVWEEFETCSNVKTGKIDYRNPVKSYDCGYQTYQWRIENEEICGNAAPKNADVVFTEPEINVDKPYNENE